MNDFDPVTLFSILHEAMGLWLWLLLGISLVLLAGIVANWLALRRAGRPARRPATAALVAGLIAAAALTFAAPAWTLTGPAALSAMVDYIFAFLLALVPAAAIAALVFMLAARRCASREIVHT